MQNREAIDEAAAHWVSLRSGGLTADQEEEFTAWLRADPRHGKALAHMEGVSQALNQLSLLRPVSGTPDPDLELSPARRRRWFPVALAAAAAVVLAVVGISRYQYLRWYSASAETEIGGFQTICLADGSLVELNTGTGVRVQFSPRERRVQLVHGEARFSVAKNPARPFVVSAGGVAVEAVGTAFNVRLKDEAVEVLVTEGRVRLNDEKQGTSLLGLRPDASASDSIPSLHAGLPFENSTPAIAPPVVAAGHRAIVPVAVVSTERAPTAAATVTPVAPEEISRVRAWEHRRLIFDPTPLRAVVAEFNRYNRHKLVVADSEIAGILVGGAFDVHDHQAFTRLLETGFSVAVEREENETLLRASH